MLTHGIHIIYIEFHIHAIGLVIHEVEQLVTCLSSFWLNLFSTTNLDHATGIVLFHLP